MSYQPASSPVVSPPRSPLYKLWVVIFLLAIAAASAMPLYLSGNWTLDKVPELSNVQALQALQKTGLTLPGWQTTQQQTVTIAGHKWSVQAIAPASSSSEPQAAETQAASAVLMLRPQTWHRDLPQVDWMDIRGVRSWTEDRDRHLSFSIPRSGAASIPVEARFFRGWTDEQTYAVLQWYAWRDGGDAAPSSWFWAEQRSQLRDRQHLSWVGISLLMPIQPLGEIEPAQSQLKALAKQIQSALITDVLK
jgi:cyanoexosortase B-associated protein